jgi:lipoprotein Spr
LELNCFSHYPQPQHTQYDFCIKIDKEKLQEGDLVFFKTKRRVSHVGIYLGNDCFVHSSTSSGVTINKLTDDYYSRKFIGGGRITK